MSSYLLKPHHLKKKELFLYKDDGNKQNKLTAASHSYKNQYMFKNFLYGIFYDGIMFFPEKIALGKRRRKLISGLSGKVLEVGVGTGVNFIFYNDQVSVTGIEPSETMLSRALKKRKRLKLDSRIELHLTGWGFPEMMELVEENSLDAVVCTLVLCTIPEPEKALEHFKKWLKPGGQLVIMEHIRAHTHFYGKILDAANPYWSKFADGCQLNRSTDIMLTKAGFTMQYETRFNLVLPFYEAVYVKQ